MLTKPRKLGNSSVQVAPLAFGGNVFGWTVDEAAPIASATTLEQLDDLITATRLQLNSTVIALLDHASD
ncbi:hypothetical protein [Paraherbaspirillum soli]|uniref:Aldo/keto reductase n=1 Tax=Paraherbaspirillum soli TaxID=631222 RepID=A0ABW0MCG9_9BURK